MRLRELDGGLETGGGEGVGQRGSLTILAESIKASMFAALSRAYQGIVPYVLS